MPNMVELGALAKTLAPIINKEVDKAFSGLSKRIEALELRPVIDDAIKQEIIKQTADNVINNIPCPEQGEKGEDGKSVTVDDVEPMLKEYIDGILAFMPAPKDGEPGQKGDKGEDGKSVSQEEVCAMVSEAVAKAVSEIEIPKAQDGKDALQLEILPEFDESKSYVRGTYALRDGGIWRAWQQTDGMKGWEPVTRGFPIIEHEIVDERYYVIRAVQTGGEPVEKRYKLPVMIYRGTWTDKAYDKGDTVTSAGSLWHCEEDNNEKKPGTVDSGWRLCAKKGRDGSK